MPRRLGFLLLLALAACSRTPPNVVVVTLESERVDEIGCFGASAPTTPALDAICAESTIYPNAHSVTSWTLTAHASLFTGLYPSTHRVLKPRDQLGDSYTTLAESLAAKGYETLGVVSGPFLRKSHALHQGFTSYDDSFALGLQQAEELVLNPRVTESLETMLAKRDPKKPFFLFAYYWDPHYDYIPPPPYDKQFLTPGAQPIEMRHYYANQGINAQTPPEQLEFIRSQYRGEIRWTDDFVGRLRAVLEKAKLWDNTIVVITSDHGEEFFEHGAKGHKNNLYAESLRVPLVVKYPGGKMRGRDERLASHVDVVPTVLEVAGVPGEATVHGRSLLAPADPARPIFFELYSVWYHSQPQGPLAAVPKQMFGVRQGEWWMVTTPDEKKSELFDMGRDPAQKSDLAAARPDVVSELGKAIIAWQGTMVADAKKFQPGAPVELSEEEAERLRSLGYLGQ